MRRSLALAGVAVAMCVAAGTPLHAQGSGVDQQSACMTGRVGAGVANPCDDASAIYFSPAGLAMRPSAFSLGATIVRSGNTFRYDAGQGPADLEIERETETKAVPQAYVSYRAGDRLAVGVGVFAPFGLGLKWDVCSTTEANTAACTPENNFEGRYTGYDQELRGIYVQPTVAYQIIPNRLSLGVGVDFVSASIEVHRRADAPQLGLSGTDIADAALSGDGTGVTGHVALLARLSDRVHAGIRYLAPAKIEMDGSADFTQIATQNAAVNALLAPQFAEGAPLDDQSISTEVEFPAQLVAGVAFRPFEPLALMLDYQWTKWETFDAFVLDFENASAPDQTLTLGYDNTSTIRLGADYMWSDALSLRAGYRYNTAATPRATPFLPEGERNYYTLGLGYRVTSRLGVDASFQHIVQPDRRGAVRPGAPNVGVYTSTGQTFGFTLSYRFGGGDPR
jgi:long-chain fatty acid transport protein